MYIKKIQILNYRNYKSLNITLGKNVNVFMGDNAQGKTNILEAIYYCAFARSHRTSKDRELINWNEESAYVSILVGRDRLDKTIDINILKDGKKAIRINKIKASKIGELFGNFNVVMFSPEDLRIIKDSPGVRRKFIDMMISSLKPNYIHILNNYNKTLEQRNSYLRQIKYEKKSEKMLDIWDEQLSDFAEKVFLYRKNYIEKISNKISVIHNLLTKSGKLQEEIQIKYTSTGKDKQTFLENLKKSRSIDISKGYTSVGIHRDDLIIYINNRPVNLVILANKSPIFYKNT